MTDIQEQIQEALKSTGVLRFPSDRFSLAAAVMPLVKRAQEAAFQAGWMSSGEGWNGEYPDEGVPWGKSAGREAYEQWIEKEAGA